MAEAKYTVHVPIKDNLGNELPDLATAAHHHLYKNHGVKGSWIEGPHRGNWQDDPQEELAHLVMVLEDHPKHDSVIKQTAAHIGEAGNQWGVFVMKEGKNGVQSWIVPNKQYREGEPAQIGPESAPTAP